jgi:hypothetical protein
VKSSKLESFMSNALKASPIKSTKSKFQSKKSKQKEDESLEEEF